LHQTRQRQTWKKVCKQWKEPRKPQKHPKGLLLLEKAWPQAVAALFAQAR
jgi:hypothetical protein